MKNLYSRETKAVADRLVAARKAKSLTQADVAVRFKCSQSYISKVERGQLRVDVIQLKAFARLYGVSLESLAG